MRVAITDAVRVRQFECMVEFDCALVGLSLAQNAVQHRGFGDLLVDRDRRVEGRGRALREVGDFAAAQVTLLERRHRQHVLAEQAAFAAGEIKPGLGVGERRQ